MYMSFVDSMYRLGVCIHIYDIYIYDTDVSVHVCLLIYVSSDQLTTSSEFTGITGIVVWVTAVTELVIDFYSECLHPCFNMLQLDIQEYPPKLFFPP